jgi:hypothetical protein
MFVIPTRVGLTYRAVAMLVASAVVLATLGWQTTAQAANLTEVSNTLTDSAPGVLSGHDIRFTVPTSSTLLVTATTSITFPAGFTGLGTLSISDITVTVNGTPDAPATFNVTGQVVSFTGVTATATDDVRVVFVSNEITNPGVGSYEFIISTPSDTGRTRVAIVNTVEVTAQVNTTFDFQVLGTTTSAVAINGTTTTGTTSATAIPFGVVAVGIQETLLQTLTVVTNARNGFSVTVEQDGNLESSTGADIDGFANGAYTNTPTTWSAPSNTLLQENTYGHWGLTSNDSDLNAGEFTSSGGNKWVAASTTPRVIFTHNGPADGVTQDYGRVDVGYQIQIASLQEAADDYNTTLTYIATPTF